MQPDLTTPTMMSEKLRFIRLNPRFRRDETLSLLKAEIQTTYADNKQCPLPVPWLRSKRDSVEFYAIPGDFSLNRSPLFQSGRVYGMDVTSGAAVVALLFDLYDDVGVADDGDDGNKSSQDETPLRVLDVCCAPGLKLCMLADLAPPSSMVIGVDISQNRIQLCKNVVKKYHIFGNTTPGLGAINVALSPKEQVSEKSHPIEGTTSSCTTIRLYCTDGTTFGTKQTAGLVFDSNAEMEESKTRGKRKRQNKSARAREKRRLVELQRQDEAATKENVSISKDSPPAKSKTVQDNCAEASNEEKAKDEATTTCIPLFDRVLVDAECSTDGAIRHIQKRQNSSRTHAHVWNDTNMNELVQLQKSLLESGFRLLKNGGRLIYSTCSLNAKQNEEVVDWLLKKHGNAFLIPVSFATYKEQEHNLAFIEDGAMPGTVRFNPIAHEGTRAEECLPGTGFFLSKISKR